jgi:ABC-type multidrug transport system fused ATPase/permease subunit
VQNIDLMIRGGERIGLVGRSGAGKSTLVNLVLRFYDPDEGRVLIDGQDIALCRQESVREHIAMVTQDTSLTVIAIAHRLSTIRRMDRFVVLDEGHIVEEGTHETLLARRGLYARFWERQAGGLIGVAAAE